MKKKIWVFGALVCVVCLALLVFKSKQRKTEVPVSPQHAEALITTQANTPNRIPSETNPQTGHSPPNTAILSLPENASQLARAIAETNPAGAKVLANWQTPIDFYGKVVDENSNVIVGARVTFDWVEVPDETGNRATNTESDSEGLFSLTGQRGPDLGIEVSKEGYYARKSYARYGLGNSNFSPDPRNPVVFTLKKKGTPAQSLVSVKQNCRIPRDGTPVAIDLATGAKTTAENGSLVVQCWTDDQGKSSGEKYDWRCDLTIPGGGIVAIPSGEEFPFLAPETGYSTNFEINMPASSTNWNSQVDQKFYYRTADGRYGRMAFSMIAGGQHFFMVDSILNPTGSPNLEPQK